MKKHVMGVSGIVIAVALAVWQVLMRTTSAAGKTTQLDLALAVVILGIVAAVRGSLLWSLLSLAGLIEVLFVIF